MNTLKIGDVFSLSLSAENHYVGFVQSGKEKLTLVILDTTTEEIKTLTNFSAINIKTKKLDKKDMPLKLKKAYKENFVTIKKGNKVSFFFNDVLHKGIVVRGGKRVKVEVVMDDKKIISEGPASMYTVLKK
jgi:hypothetical protein